MKYLVEFINDHYGTGGSFKKGDIKELDVCLVDFLLNHGKIKVINLIMDKN